MARSPLLNDTVNGPPFPEQCTASAGPDPQTTGAGCFWCSKAGRGSSIPGCVPLVAGVGAERRGLGPTGDP